MERLTSIKTGQKLVTLGRAWQFDDSRKVSVQTLRQNHANNAVVMTVPVPLRSNRLLVV